MKRALLLVGLALLLFMTACNSEESKEVLEYHNSFVEEVTNKSEQVDAGYDKIDLAETNEEVIEISNQEMLPVLDEIKKYMDDQNPKTDDTKEYHQLRLEWFEVYDDLVRTELQAMEDYINDDISEEEFDETLEGLYSKLDEANDLAAKADDKIEELSDKYDFEEMEE